MEAFADDVSVKQYSTLVAEYANIDGSLYIAGQKQFKVLGYRLTKEFSTYAPGYHYLDAIKVSAKTGDTILQIGWMEVALRDAYKVEVNPVSLPGLTPFGNTSAKHYPGRSQSYGGDGVSEPMGWLFAYRCTADGAYDMKVMVSGLISETYINPKAYNVSQIILSY